MLNPPRCKNCGAEKKTRQGLYCQKCGTQQRYINNGVNWTLTEKQQLIQYCQLTAYIAELQNQITNQKNRALQLKQALLKRHSARRLSAKINYMQSTGQIIRVHRVRLCKLEAT